MKKELLFFTLLSIAICGCGEKKQANAEIAEENKVETVDQLVVYTAADDIRSKYLEEYFPDEYFELMAGDYISDNQAQFFTITEKDKDNYLYGGELDCDYFSCIIPKSKVETTTYDMGKLPVSLIGDGIKLKHGDELLFTIDIVDSNGHKFHTFLPDTYKYQIDEEVTKEYKKMCIITEMSEWGKIEYILPIKDGYVPLYDENGKCVLLSSDWMNYDMDNEAAYTGPSFEKGKLVRDIYENSDKPEWLESFCYIPSKNAFHVGNGLVVEMQK